MPPVDQAARPDRLDGALEGLEDLRRGRPLIRRRVVVHGWVQGVFFRDTVRRIAAQRSVAGWVRNNPDGTVEAVLEGRPEAVEHVTDFLRKGPRDAEVERVEVLEEQPQGLSGFIIR